MDEYIRTQNHFFQTLLLCHSIILNHKDINPIPDVATISSHHPLFFPPFYDYYQNRFDLITEHALYSNSK